MSSRLAERVLFTVCVAATRHLQRDELDSLLAVNTALGPLWGNATAALEPRVVRFGVT